MSRTIELLPGESLTLRSGFTVAVPAATGAIYPTRIAARAEFSGGSGSMPPPDDRTNDSGASFDSLNVRVGIAVQRIRRRIALTHEELGKALALESGSVDAIERGLSVLTPHLANRLITVAAARGLVLSFDHVYGGRLLAEV